MNTSKLDAKYTLFDSIEEMLAPETLSELLAEPVTQVECFTTTVHEQIMNTRMPLHPDEFVYS